MRPVEQTTKDLNTARRREREHRIREPLRNLIPEPQRAATPTPWAHLDRSVGCATATTRDRTRQSESWQTEWKEHMNMTAC